MSRDLSWARDGRDWPNREASRHVEAGGLSWHVQVFGELDGQRPVLLLAHGTGASTHSWRDLAPILARHVTIVAPDLPGHAFTSRPPYPELTLPGMGAALGALLRELDVAPDLAVGHSAGAAILCRMALDGVIAPRGIVSLNGALRAFRGVAGTLFSPLAKLLAWNPFAPSFLVATMSGRRSVERLLEETGSVIDERGTALYHRLVQSPAHVGSALAMMAGWDLDGLERDMPRLKVPLLLVAAANDRSIPPSVAHAVKARAPGARVKELRGLGHLAHEEKPDEIATLILDFARSVGVEAGG